MIATRVDKVYISKDNIFYDIIVENGIKATTIYNQCIFQERERIIHYLQTRENYANSNNIEDLKDPIVSNYMKSLVASKQEGPYSYEDLYAILKDETKSFYRHYKSLHSHIVQQMIKKVSNSFKVYITKKSKGMKVGLPRFKKHSEPSTFSMTTSCFKKLHNKDYIEITDKRFNVGKRRLLIKVKAHKREDFVSYQQLSFRFLDDKVEISVIYRINIDSKRKDNSRYISIDLGLSNYATITNNVGLRPIIIHSESLLGRIKSVNERISYLKSLNVKYHKSTKVKDTKQIKRLRRYLRNYQDNFEHHVCNYIIKYCLEHEINTIVIGYNKNWKCKSNLNKKTNRVFQVVSFSRFIFKLGYKCEAKGLKLVTVNESYTSGTSFLNCEYPNKKNYNKSRRIKRGLFRTQTVFNRDMLINADVNASYQILKKYKKSIYKKKSDIQNLKINAIGIDVYNEDIV